MRHGRLAYAAGMPTGFRPGRVVDVHELALGMPHVTVGRGPSGNPVYQVGGKSFVFFRTPPGQTPPTQRRANACRT